MSHLINIFLEPSKVFAELKEKPSFVLPFVVVTLVATLMSFLYFMKVDGAWFIDHTLLSSGTEMTKVEMEQAKNFMPGAKFMGYLSLVMTPITTAVLTLVIALYYLLAGKITGSTIGFKHSLSLVCWSSMPLLLGTIVALVGVFMMTPQTSIESLMLTSLDPLLLQLPTESPWKKLASSFSFLTFWSIFVGSLGWRVWTKASWVEAIAVVTIPWVLYFGCLALLALI